MATIGGEPGGRAPIVVEDNLGQDADAPPQDDHTTAAQIGAAEPGRDVFAKDKQKDIKSQKLASDAPVDADEKEISVVKFEPTSATPESASRGKGRNEVHNGDTSTSTRTGEPEGQRVPEVIKSQEEVIRVGEDSDSSRVTNGPLAHEEAIADQVAYELYPDAMDTE
jgi:dolichyl-phosphate-mannose-protein mannosyltransferase